MELYIALAKELLESLDRKKKGPPPEDVRASMRGEMAVLRLLMDENHPLSAGEISRTLKMTTPRIAAVLGSLQKKGLVDRVTDPSDKRRVMVTLTENGISLCKKRKQRAVSQISHMLSCLGEEDARHFVRLIKRVQDILPPPPGMEEEEFDQKEGYTK